MLSGRQVASSYTRWGLIVLGLLIAAGLMARSGTLWEKFLINTGYLALNNALVSTPEGQYEHVETIFSGVEPGTVERERALRAIGLTRMSQRDLPGAVSAWEQLAESSTEINAWARRAERDRDWASARDWYWLQAQIEPENGDNWYKLAEIVTRLGDEDTARDYYRTALSTGNLSAWGQSNIMTRLGELAKRTGQGEWQEAIDWFDQALRQDDFKPERDRVQARMGRAEAYDNLQQPEKALADYRWVADRQPRNYWARVHSGRLVWSLDKDATAAEIFLREAIEIDEGSKWAYRNLALVYAQSGQTDQAISLFKRVLALDPGDQLAKNQLQLLEGSHEP